MPVSPAIVPAIVPATPEMAARISALVQHSFTALAAGDWAPEARRVFLAESSPSSIAAALRAPAFAAVAAHGQDLAGFILMGRASRLDMLFVHPGHLREGIARRLWEDARRWIGASHAQVRSVELNATPCSLDAYRALGFVPVSPEFTRGGCRATRMAFTLPANAAGAGTLRTARSNGVPER